MNVCAAKAIARVVSHPPPCSAAPLSQGEAPGADHRSVVCKMMCSEGPSVPVATGIEKSTTNGAWGVCGVLDWRMGTWRVMYVRRRDSRCNLKCRAEVIGSGLRPDAAYRDRSTWNRPESGTFDFPEQLALEISCQNLRGSLSQKLGRFRPGHPRASWLLEPYLYTGYLYSNAMPSQYCATAPKWKVTASAQGGCEMTPS